MSGPVLHFELAEFAARRARLDAAMATRELDAMLLFAPESQYWLTGFDTFGYCFFQCLVVPADGAPVLLTRSADRLQAELTSTIEDVRIWVDGAGADPAGMLAALLADLGLSGKRLGLETETHGLTARNGERLQTALAGRVTLVEASDLVPELRLTKSPAEIAMVRRAAELGDEAHRAALPHMRPGGSEAAILAAMQGAIFAGGGDYPGNEFIIGSGPQALLCRYYSGRRILDDQDQLTLEWAGTWRHYHAALMRTVVIGEPRPTHRPMHAAAHEALLACEAALRPGATLGAVFAAHAETFDHHGLGAHRLNACGYALGARFSPSWMEPQMFYADAPGLIGVNQVYFLHMILMDQESGTAVTLGRTSLVTESGAEPLSGLPLDLEVR
ncbi:MAG: Xaa-Pro peptidase family protein [Pseudomonadota bacterium]